MHAYVRNVILLVEQLRRGLVDGSVPDFAQLHNALTDGGFSN